jgi:hypothetical protein
MGASLIAPFHSWVDIREIFSYSGQVLATLLNIICPEVTYDERDD